MSEDKNELINLTLSEKAPSHETSLIEAMIRDLREALPGVLTDLSQSGRGWVRGKSAQEVARAQEILAGVIDRVGRLALDEKDQAHRHKLEREKHDAELRRENVELYLSSMKQAGDIVRELTEAGIEVDIVTILRGLPIRSAPENREHNAIGE